MKRRPPTDHSEFPRGARRAAMQRLLVLWWSSLAAISIVALGWLVGGVIATASAALLLAVAPHLIDSRE